MNHGSVHGFVHALESHSDHLKLSLIMFYLNMLDYTVFFPMLSTLTFDKNTQIFIFFTDILFWLIGNILTFDTYSYPGRVEILRSPEINLSTAIRADNTCPICPILREFESI